MQMFVACTVTLEDRDPSRRLIVATYNAFFQQRLQSFSIFIASHVHDKIVLLQVIELCLTNQTGAKIRIQGNRKTKLDTDILLTYL